VVSSRFELALVCTLRAEILTSLNDVHNAESANLMVAVCAAVRRHQFRVVVANHADPVAATPLEASRPEEWLLWLVAPHVAHTLLTLWSLDWSFYPFHPAYRALPVPDGAQNRKKSTAPEKTSNSRAS
jgi:hypothetical protein